MSGFCTLIVDASYGAGGAAGWACWCKADGVPSHQQGGIIQLAKVSDNHDAKLGACQHLSLYYGVQTNEWPGSAEKGWFLPWTVYRHVRRTLYDALGNNWHELLDPEPLPRSATPDQRRRAGTLRAENERMVVKACPVHKFLFRDFDGEELVATVRLEQREWRRGEGLFRWLGKWYSPIVQNYVAIDFSGEVGRRKGSWKGGTTSHSGPRKPWQKHKTAFREYCEANELEFLSAYSGAQE